MCNSGDSGVHAHDQVAASHDEKTAADSFESGCLAAVAQSQGRKLRGAKSSVGPKIRLMGPGDDIHLANPAALRVGACKRETSSRTKKWSSLGRMHAGWGACKLGTPRTYT